MQHRLSLAELESLAEALLDFTIVSDLQNWLSQNKPWFLEGDRSMGHDRPNLVKLETVDRAIG